MRHQVAHGRHHRGSRNMMKQVTAGLRRLEGGPGLGGETSGPSFFMGSSMSAMLDGSVGFYQAEMSLFQAVRVMFREMNFGHGFHYGKESQFGWRGDFSCQLKSI